ncbi:hypothetical protein FKP32DRAFT_1589057 [Trametes sanguinea]|nr:hypothetical protein FKP32DRAFT_1589057 [Trametes sanguinea]
METSLNTQLSTIGAFYPQSTLSALFNLHISAGRNLVDIPPDAYWKSEPHDRAYARLSVHHKPLALRLIAILRNPVVDCYHPHMTVIPLFERDASLCHSLFDNTDINFDWEIEPDGYRPPVILTVEHTHQRPCKISDSTNLRFNNTPNQPTLPIQVLKRNDIIVASISIQLHAPILAPPSYTFIAHHIALVHSATDDEAGLGPEQFVQDENDEEANDL